MDRRWSRTDKRWVTALLSLALLVVITGGCGEEEPEVVASGSSGRVGSTVPAPSCPPPPGSSVPAEGTGPRVDDEACRRVDLVPTLKANAHIARGTSVDQAAAVGAFETVEVPARFRPETAVEDVDELAGVALFGIGPGTVIVDGMFVPPTAPSAGPAER